MTEEYREKVFVETMAKEFVEKYPRLTNKETVSALIKINDYNMVEKIISNYRLETYGLYSCISVGKKIKSEYERFPRRIKNFVLKYLENIVERNDLHEMYSHSDIIDNPDLNVPFIIRKTIREGAEEHRKEWEKEYKIKEEKERNKKIRNAMSKIGKKQQKEIERNFSRELGKEGIEKLMRKQKIKKLNGLKISYKTTHILSPLILKELFARKKETNRDELVFLACDKEVKDKLCEGYSSECQIFEIGEFEQSEECELEDNICLYENRFEKILKENDNYYDVDEYRKFTHQILKKRVKKGITIDEFIDKLGKRGITRVIEDYDNPYNYRSRDYYYFERRVKNMKKYSNKNSIGPIDEDVIKIFLEGLFRKANYPGKGESYFNLEGKEEEFKEFIAEFLKEEQSFFGRRRNRKRYKTSFYTDSWRYKLSEIMDKLTPEFIHERRRKRMRRKR